MKRLLISLAVALAGFGAAQAQPAAPAGPSGPPTQVMIVADFHMNNPGHDLRNVHVDDVLAPQAQMQIAAVTDALARFHPTVVDVEWPVDLAAQRYAKYLSGTLEPSRNEVIQLGFRLVKTAGLKTVQGIDVDGDFPFDKVDAYARAHDQGAVVDAAMATVNDIVATQTRLLKEQGVAANLRYLNDPARLAGDNGFYRTTLRVGAGSDQPGADLLTAWYRRNFLICANLIQQSKPGDRVVVFYGAGHAFLLRQCVRETPGFELVEANDYLPK